MHTLTADMVAAHAAKAASGAPTPAPAAPEDAEALRLKGNDAFGRKRFEEAVKLYGEALTLDGGNGLLYGNRAAALMQLGRHQQALVDAKQMVLLLPDLAKAHFRLGSALSSCGQPADAARALRSAVELDPASEAIAEALRRELGRPALKKGKQHAELVAACQQTLAGRHGGTGGGGAALPRMRWSELLVGKTEARPAKRGGATLSAAAGRLWLVGGADRTGSVQDDVWEYAPAESSAAAAAVSWRRHEAGDGFRARSGHAACAVPPIGAAGALAGGTSGAQPAVAAIVVFGGQDPRSSVLLDDVQVLRVPCVAAQPDMKSEEAVWESGAAFVTHGTRPEARNGHSLSHDADGARLVLFGGANAEGHLADVHTLSLPRAAGGGGAGGGAGGAPIDVTDVTDATGGGALAAEWTRPKVSGAVPVAREMHAAAVVGGRLIVHGGRGGDALLSDVCVLDLSTWTWLPALTSACTRVGHAALVLAPALADDSTSAGRAAAPRMLVMGGFSGDAMCNDTHELSVEASGAPTVPRKVGADTAPPRRFAHAAAAIGSVLYVFGGSAATEDLDDLHAADAAEALAAR